MSNPEQPGFPDPSQPPPYGQAPQSGQTPYGQPQYGQPSYNQPAYGHQAAHQGMAQLSPDQERFWGSGAHWGALVAGFVTSGFLAWLVPLVVMIAKGNESPFVRRQAVESLNFQISMIIYAVVSGVLLLVLVGFILLPVVAIWWLVGTILGAVKANNGEDNRFKLIFRFVS